MNNVKSIHNSTEGKEMIVKITTEYKNCDEAWVSWYLARLANENVLPGSIVLAGQLRETRYADFISKDPSSKVVAKTTYEIIDEVPA